MVDNVCSQCGKNIPNNARFCRFCGTKIVQEQAKEGLFRRSVFKKEEEPESSISAYDREPVGMETATKSIEIPPIPEEQIMILYTRYRKKELKEEKNAIIKEMEELEEKLKIGLIEIDVFQVQFAELDSRSDVLKSEKKGFVDGTIPAEEMIADYETATEKLDKIEKMKEEKKISSEKVYEKLKKEYSDKKAEVSTKLLEEKQKIKSWINTLEIEAKSASEEIEAVDAKVSLEDISNEEGIRQKKELKIKEKTRSIAARAYTELLEKIKI